MTLKATLPKLLSGVNLLALFQQLPIEPAQESTSTNGAISRLHTSSMVPGRVATMRCGKIEVGISLLCSTWTKSVTALAMLLGISCAMDVSLVSGAMQYVGPDCRSRTPQEGSFTDSTGNPIEEHKVG